MNDQSALINHYGSPNPNDHSFELPKGPMLKVSDESKSRDF